MVYKKKDDGHNTTDVSDTLAPTLETHVKEHACELGAEAYFQVSEAAGSNYQAVHVSDKVSHKEGARIQDGKIQVSADALATIYRGLRESYATDGATDAPDIEKKIITHPDSKNFHRDMITRNLLQAGQTYTPDETEPQTKYTRADLETLRGNLLESVSNAAKDLESQKLDQEPANLRKKTGRHQKNLFILFLVLGISSIAALQNIDPANSSNTTGYFLTSVSLASTNVIFVLFVFITGFILGRRHN